MKKLERARKQAETVTDSVDVTEREKWHKIKQYVLLFLSVYKVMHR